MLNVDLFSYYSNLITSGNQKWNGAAPNLIISDEFSININAEFIKGL
jgi:hypothetical protein